MMALPTFRPFRPGTRFLLDSISTPAVSAYSLRRLSAAYSGPVVRVRRSSDNTEQDFNLSGNLLDTSSLLSFVGANNGFVTIWYDQTGNNRHVSESVASNQPFIVTGGVIEAINGVPAIRSFVGASASLDACLSNNGLMPTNFARSNITLFSVANRTANSNWGKLINIRNKSSVTSSANINGVPELTARLTGIEIGAHNAGVADAGVFVNPGSGNAYNRPFAASYRRSNSGSTGNGGTISVRARANTYNLANSGTQSWDSGINNSLCLLVQAHGSTPTRSWIGTVGECVIYGTNLSDSDMVTIEANANASYGLWT